jgi:hypothetical protein
MTQHARVPRPMQLALTQGRTFASLFIGGQAPRVLCWEQWMVDVAKQCDVHGPFSATQKISTYDDCERGSRFPLAFNNSNKNTGAHFPASDFDMEKVSVKAVDDNGDIESLPRSKNSVASAAFHIVPVSTREPLKSSHCAHHPRQRPKNSVAASVPG